MSQLNLVSLLGWCVFCLLAWLIGGCRRPVAWRTVAGSTLFTFLLAAVVFLLPATRGLLLVLNEVILAALTSSAAGAEFLLGPLALSPGQISAAGESSVGLVLAAQVLPAMVFFASIMAVLHHLGWIAPIVRLFGRVFHRTLALSGAESLAGSLHIFFGVETAAAVRPYLGRMTRSELLAVLTTNLATVASTTLAVYVIFLREAFPQIAGHLLSASLLSIPCAMLATKLMLPETETPETASEVPEMATSERHTSALGALSAGAWDGLRVAAGVAVILIAILGLVRLFDLTLGGLGGLVGQEGWSLTAGLGWFFRPVAWLLGIEAADIAVAGKLLGQRVILTEVVSYQELGGAAAELSPRTLLVLSYALCGFAHVGGMGISLGGFGAMVPERRDELAQLAVRALAAATLATLLTGCLAGVFYHGQSGLLGL